MYLYIESRKGDASNETVRDADPDVHAFDIRLPAPFGVPPKFLLPHGDKIHPSIPPPPTQKKSPKIYPHPQYNQYFSLSKKGHDPLLPHKLNFESLLRTSANPTKAFAATL